MDFSVYDALGDTTNKLYKQVQAGKLLDPREARANKQTREEFRRTILQWQKEELSGYDAPYHDDMSQEQVELNLDISLLEAKIMAVTPPQGYINAPYYYFPEELDELFEAGKLDRKLDPRIEAYRRVGFPHELVKRIEEFKAEEKK
ncbi:hypothetical protein CQA57_06930 [Helicobacter anseris]|uniref:Uncharacterized protein n=1 Tax=Helicobacter anseris TaxID=375926 RepID=A0A3D8J4N1_9HELI|nr:hypothetical protein CQA57_06930 [Helicobacter anseris]